MGAKNTYRVHGIAGHVADKTGLFSSKQPLWNSQSFYSPQECSGREDSGDKLPEQKIFIYNMGIKSQSCNVILNHLGRKNMESSYKNIKKRHVWGGSVLQPVRNKGLRCLKIMEANQVCYIDTCLHAIQLIVVCSHQHQ